VSRNRKKKKKRAELKPPCPPRGDALLLNGREETTGRWWVLPATLAGLTLVVWARSFAVSLVGWDDTTYLFEDARLNPLSPSNIWGILTRPFFANYHPVTTLTYAFDRAVWDTWAPGFHMTQLAFYAGGVVMLYFLFKALLISPRAAFAAAALYAAHTAHVESVAWLASRKDVVCLFFYAGAILAYVRYKERRTCSWRLYATSVALAGAAMFSKGYAVVLPAVLFAYDLCFGERIGRREMVDKLPFALFAASTIILTVFAQDEASALVEPSISSWHRIWALLQILACYVGRSLFPVKLSAIYVIHEAWLNLWAGLLGAALGVGAVAGFIVLRRRLPAGAFGIALFVLPLGSVMNVFFTLRSWMADRYLFLPTIGSVLALTAAGVWLSGRPTIAPRFRRWAMTALAGGVVLLYAGLTVARIGVWTNPVLLWSDALRKQFDLGGSGPVTAHELAQGRAEMLPDPRAAVWLAQAYKRQRRSSEAEALLTWIRSLQQGIEADDETREIDVARLEIEAGRYDDAVSRLRPLADGGTWLAPVALGWIGVAYERKGELEASRMAHHKALERYRQNGRPGTPAMLDLGGLAFRAHGFDEAAQWYRRACKEDPTDPRGTFFLGLSLEMTGQVEEAYRLYSQTLELEGRVRPDIPFSFADVHLQMGIAAEKLVRLKEAVRHFQEALRRLPDHPQQAGLRAKIENLGADLKRQRK